MYLLGNSVYTKLILITAPFHKAYVTFIGARNYLPSQNNAHSTGPHGSYVHVMLHALCETGPGKVTFVRVLCLAVCFLSDLLVLNTLSLITYLIQG